MAKSFLTISERVLNGIGLLNKSQPNWLDHVKIDDPDMNDACFCILGQLFGNFYRGAKQLCDEFPNRGIDYGFEGNTKTDYNKLQAEWIRQITLLRAK